MEAGRCCIVILGQAPVHLDVRDHIVARTRTGSMRAHGLMGSACRCPCLRGRKQTGAAGGSADGLHFLGLVSVICTVSAVIRDAAKCHWLGAEC